MKRNIALMIVVLALSAGTLAIAGDTASSRDACPAGCCEQCPAPCASGSEICE
jgi:hypothetical protein